MNKDDDKEGLAMFSALIDGIKPITQDKRHFRTPLKTKQEIELKEQQLHANSYFSDTYQPLLPVQGPMRWLEEGVDSLELKRLRRGDYQPDLLLDLHGYRQSEAKLELAALIQACVKQQSLCCCIMHGYGSGILKQQVPMWLVQHPMVKAFHQAPKEWGGDAALLVLIDIGEQPHRR
ncbi:endonuclease SmrB [Shewanella oncorhynchi]|jgi:DNA-nicking Smr family endonuclease|uniref:Ribosome rescue factor SmrB n=1 Tax=Shewanella oncorhynchi TaxID=2726434 RepID=A0AA50Q872_9GAMM|nr:MULTISPECIES: endonuclease SmrB [Shewanella]WMB74575.1 endonuclease SmrB [Shewanella oncorhynchi]